MGFSELAAFKEDWRTLAERSRNIFGTWEWAETWWRHFGRDGELRTTHIPSVAILPLYVDRAGPFRLLRFLGHGHADEVGPVCAPEDRPVAASSLREALAGDGFHLFLGDGLPGGWGELVDARVLDRESSPVLPLTESSWDEFLAARSSGFRQQVRRFERRLGKEHELRFRLADADSLQQDLDALFALHRARWPGSPWFADAEAFHRDFAGLALERGWLRLWILELDGHPAAAWLGYRFAGVESFYQSGRDPGLQRERVGFVLLAHTIREALEGGIGEYRFLRGDEGYKFRFATTDPGLETLARPRGLLGEAALALRSARRFLR